MLNKKHILLSLLICFNVIATAEKKEFDFIIVGSGCAGTVALERLTEDPSVEVLCIDAGKYHRSYNVNAEGLPTTTNYCRVDEGLLARKPKPLIDHLQAYRAMYPAKFGLGHIPSRFYNNNHCERASIILFGGGSTVNGQDYWRGSPWMFDYFAEDLKLKGWSWNDVQPLHEKVEFTTLDNIAINTTDFPDRGTSGPLLVDIFSRAVSLTTATMIGAALNIPFFQDYQIANYDNNGKLVKEMTSLFQFNNTRVVSGYIDYFNQENIRKTRSNVHTKLATPVWRVLFDEKKEGGKYRAIGVQTTTGEKYYARKEVLINGGFFGSIKLLLLSGIGDQADLEKLCIKTYIHSPGVGKLVGEHGRVFRQPALIPSAYPFPEESIELKMITRNNPNSLKDFPDAETNLDIERAARGTRITFSSSYLHQWPITSEVKLISNDPTIDAAVQRSLVNVFTTDGKIKPEVASLFIGLYRNQVRHLYSFYDYYRGLGLNPGLPIAQPIRLDEDILWVVDQAGVIKRDTDPTLTDADILVQFEKALKINSLYRVYRTNNNPNHGMAGCRMGNREIDPEAVVDNKFRVYGTCNLRVIDNSIMPRIPGRDECAGLFGHPSAWCYMFGEKVSQLIKNKYGYSSIAPKPCN